MDKIVKCLTMCYCEKSPFFLDITGNLDVNNNYLKEEGYEIWRKIRFGFYKRRV